MASTNLKLVAGALLVASLVVPLLYQRRTIHELRERVRQLENQIGFTAPGPERRPHDAGTRSEAAQASVPQAATADSALLRPTWHQVESPDYRQYIANMRILEVPEETIRDIVLADVEKLYDSRKKEVLKGTVRDEFWKPGGMGSYIDAKRLETLRELASEKQAVIKELLGLDMDQSDFQTQNSGLDREIENSWSFVSEEKRAMIKELTMQQRRRPFENTSNWSRDYEEALARVLSPDEKDEEELRRSGAAARLREQLRDFEPTEAEFRALFKLVKEFGGNMARFHPPGEWEKVWEQDKTIFANERFRERLASVLDEQRLSEFNKKLRTSPPRE